MHCYGICWLLALSMGAVVGTAGCEISWDGEITEGHEKGKMKKTTEFTTSTSAWVCMLVSCPSSLLLISNNSLVTTPDFRNG